MSAHESLGSIPPPVMDGCRVVELSSGYAAGLAGRFLQGYGATLVRVDTSAVDHNGPRLTADEALYVHTGKPTIDADLAVVDKVLADADLVLSDLGPAGLASLRLDWTGVRSSRPELVIVSVTPFGLSGPAADAPHTNAVAFAAGGIMSLTGDIERTPLVTGGNQAYALAGMNAFAAATTAWAARLRNGTGELIDISGQECAAGMLEYYGPAASSAGVLIARLGNRTRATWAVYPCADGWAGVFALARQTPALFALLDDPELDEERFRDPLQRVLPENEDELAAKLYVFFADKTMAELRAISLATRVPIGTATTPAQLLDSVGLAQRGAFDEIATSDGAHLRIPGRPVAGFPWRNGPDATRPRGRTGTGTTALGAVGPPRRPLAGIRVIDLTMMWAGPFATLRMAEMGADVIKVESPSAWDNIRTLLPQEGVADPWNSSYYFNAYNRDKRSLTLDLAQDAGRDMMLRLVETADVFIENYRADVLDKLGLSVDLLRARNPRLIVVSMAAFGKEGEDRDFVGFGPVIELMSGLASLTGYGDGEPFKTGISYGDPVAGTAAVAAVGLALTARERTGEGCFVDLAQRETAMVLIGEAFVAAARGDEPVHRGCRDQRFLQGCYPVVGTDQWIVISVRHDADWAALSGVLGEGAAALAPFDGAARLAHHDEIDAAITSWSSQRQPDAAVAQLRVLGIPASRVLDPMTLLEDSHLVARDFWVSLHHPKMTPYRQQGAPWRLTTAQAKVDRHMPMFGEHNREILQGELGLDDAALETLTAAKVIADEPINPGVG